MKILELGHNIRKFRLERQWTQATLAERSGLRENMISYYETGRRMPAVSVVVALADAFQVSMEVLVKGKSA